MSTLDPDRWKAASPFLDQALELPAEERAAWLEALGAKDPLLASDVQTLLDEEASLEGRGFLEHSLTAPIQPSLEGRTVGAYTLLSPIGQGGMSTVWLARRSDGRYQRRVAVKFPRLSLLGTGRERFRREGSILGRLAHPHIADLIDAGVTADGQPFLVLEHIEGESIDRYCDERGLSVAARILLFLDVLAAVAHAHANLIVHRDLKPSNVLVTAEGQVKLLDFGIAKLLAGDSDSGTVEPVTREGAVAMTPAYAAPEQIAGMAVTTATDVYSLGVLLYVLLTGEHPTGSGIHSPAELLKAIVETDPLRPSEVVRARTNGSGRAMANAVHRSTTPDRLHRALRGDLDTLVGKATKKDPRERYESVAALAEDLRRYLAHEPIRARRDTFAYRAGKFVRRNRAAVTLVSLALAGIMSGAVGTWVEARNARVERDFALRQWSRAEGMRDLYDFIKDLTPWTEEQLDAAERVFGPRPGRDVANVVEALIVISNSTNLDKRYDRLVRVAEDAYKLSRTVPDPSVRARAACALGDALSWGVTFSNNSQLPRAAALIREGLGELPDENRFSVDRAYCLLFGSHVSRVEHHPDESLSRIHQAKQALEHAPIQSEGFELKVSQGLADALRQQGLNRQAAAEYESLSARLHALGRDETGLAGSTYYKWGLSVYLLGRPLEAEKLIHRGIVVFTGTEEDPEAIPWQVIAHARALRDVGRLAQAGREAKHAQEIAAKNDTPAYVNQALLLRASIYRLSGDLARAQDMLAEVEPRLQRVLPPQDISFASLQSERALLTEARGNVGTAMTLIDRSLSIATAAAKASQQGVELVPILLTYRSDMERQLGRTEDAIADATRAEALIRDTLEAGASSCDLGHADLTLGKALLAGGKRDEALAVLRSAAENLGNTLGPDHPDTQKAQELAAPGAGAR